MTTTLSDRGRPPIPPETDSRILAGSGSRGHRLLDVRLIGRHQVAALLATGVDFAVMIALVELVHLPPPVATVLAAICGGVASFTLGRTWAFRDVHTGSLAGQASRYAAASLGGALLNGLLLAALLAVVPLPYVLARVAVSALLSLAYTYPVLTRFVFRAHSPAPARR